MKFVHVPARVALLVLILTQPDAVLGKTPDPEVLGGTVDLTGVTYVASDGPRAEIVLDAARAQYAPERGVVELEDVDLRIAGPTKSAGLTLTCERGDLDLESGDFVATGEVRGLTGDGRRFETERVVYDHERAVVRTDERVLIRDGSATMTGRGFRYRTEEGRFQLLGASVVQP